MYFKEILLIWNTEQEKFQNILFTLKVNPKYADNEQLMTNWEKTEKFWGIQLIPLLHEELAPQKNNKTQTKTTKKQKKSVCQAIYKLVNIKW